MSETKDNSDNTLRKGAPAATPAAPGGSTSGSGRKPLSLTTTRTVESGHVRQSFSHGRSKAVVVEKKKTFKIAKPGDAEAAAAAAAAQKKESVAEEAARSGLSVAEVEKRRKMLDAARERDLADAEIREAEAARRAAEAEAAAAQRKAEAAAAGIPEQPDADAQPAAPAAPSAASAVAAAAPSSAPAPRPTAAPYARPSSSSPQGRPPQRGGPAAPAGRAPAPGAAPLPGGRTGNELRPAARRGAETEKEMLARRTARGADAQGGADDELRVVKKGGIKILVKAPSKPPEEKERIKLTINNAFTNEQRERSMASLRRKQEKQRMKAMGVQAAREKVMREVIVPEAITI